MNKTHYERRSHEQGNYEITPTYSDDTASPTIPHPGDVVVTPGGGSESDFTPKN